MCEVGFGRWGWGEGSFRGIWSWHHMHIMSSEEIKSARQSQKKKGSGNQSWHVTTHNGEFSSNPKNNIRKVGLKIGQENNGFTAKFNTRFGCSSSFA
jgi:hypothetical protein